MAAALACGDSAALSHTSGLAHWDLRASSDPKIDITIATRNGLSPRDGVRIHRSGTLTPVEVTTHKGIPVTTVARTLLDAAAILQPHSLTRTVERSEILELFDLTAIQATLDLHRAHRGRSGPTTAWSWKPTVAAPTSPTTPSNATAPRTPGSPSRATASSASPTDRSGTTPRALPRASARCCAERAA
jgi:hypothetical protein